MSKHILIVEDEQDLAEALQEHLSKKGFDTEMVSTAEDALSALEGKVPDLILLDIVLPGMNGFDFLESTRDPGKEEHRCYCTLKSR